MLGDFIKSQPQLHAGVAKSADAMDLKSIGRNTIPVQVRSPAPKRTISTGVLTILKSADVITPRDLHTDLYNSSAVCYISADMVKLADTLDLGSSEETHKGSSPFIRTNVIS